MLNNEFPPLGGGTGTVNEAILKRFAHLPEIEIELITSALGREDETERFSERITIFKVPVNNQNIHHSSNRELLIFAARALFLAIIRHRHKPFDFCFAWSGVPAGAVALVLKWLVRLPYLVRVSGPDIPGFELRYRLLYPVLKPVIRVVWHGARTVVAKCECEAEMLRRIDPGINLSIVPNGVDLEAFRPGKIVFDQGPLRLLCVARLIHRKGQNDLIEAVKRLVVEGIDVTLDLVGTGDARTEYEAFVKKLGLQNRVCFWGYVPRDEIGQVYSQAHVFVLPSYNEGMSVATLEAMAAGLAIVITDTGGTSELVVDDENGLIFSNGDISALTSHLRRLANDRNLARRMGAASRMKAESFSWDNTSESYQRIMDQFIVLSPIKTALA
jgi:glycosyltransferase involved in cell wall biosynthesis